MLKEKRFISVKYRKWIASLPCCVSGIEGLTQAAHIRYQTGGGAGYKPEDKWCVPLAWHIHAEQHRTGESTFWEPYGGVEKAKKLASDLYAVKFDADRALRIIGEFRNDIRSGNGKGNCL